MRIVQTYNIGCQINVQQGLAWSEDDKLAAITSKCIYIYDLIIDPSHSTPSLNMGLSYLKNSLEVNPWLLKTGIDRSEILETTESLEDQNIIMMDKTVSPQIESGKVTFRQFIKADWIPPGVVRRSESCLVTLTTDHWVRIFAPNYRTKKTWELVSDISEKWHAFLRKNEWKSNDNKLRTLVNRTYELATTTFLWTDPYLITAQKTGTIVFWKPSPSSSSSQDFIFVKRIHSHINNPTFLQSIPIKVDDDQRSLFLLLISGTDGTIESYVVSNDDDDDIESLGNSLWSEPDYLKVTSIHWIRKDDDDTNHQRLQLLISKGSFLITCQYSIDLDTPDNSEMILGNTIVVGSSPIVNVVPQGGDDGSFLVITVSEKLYVLSTKDEYRLNDVEIEDVDNFNIHHYSCHGLAQSRGRISAITVVLQNVSTSYDHLVLRTPGKITFLTRFGSGPEILSLFTGRNSKQDFQIRRYKDALETIRVLCLKDATTPDVSVSEMKDLHLILWLKRFTRILKKDVNGEKEELEELINEILRSVAEKGLKYAKRGEKSAGFLETFLLKRPSKRLRWSCTFCGCPATTEQRPCYVSCQSGHTWPRCMLSLKVVESPSLLKCRWCHSIASPDANPDLDKSCPLCDGPYVYA